jgi:hypothetical protein
VQWELPGRLGPDPGRYVVRRYAGDDARQVIVIGGIEAPRRSRRPGGAARRRVRAAAEDATPVEVTRATVVDADRLDGEDVADAWLKRAAGSDQEAVVAGALAVLNRALHARRIAAADPFRGEIADTLALVTRVGYGTGEQVAAGEWTSARDLAPPRAGGGREAALRPQERFAALLSGRDVALAAELLALRARLDLDHERPREAALQLDAALGAGLAELESWRELDGMAARLDELAGLAPGVRAAAEAARAGGLDEPGGTDVRHALERLEAALRARTAGTSF